MIICAINNCTTNIRIFARSRYIYYIYPFVLKYCLGKITEAEKIYVSKALQEIAWNSNRILDRSLQTKETLEKVGIR